MKNKRLSQVRSSSSMLSQTKAQLKIQQMAFVLIAVTVFFVLVGMFFLGFKFSGLKRDAAGLCEDEARLLISKLANSPEFSCGFAFDTTKIACIDADKVMVLRENLGTYSNFWGVDSMEIIKIHASDSNIQCTMGNYPNCDIITLSSEEITGVGISNFVSLCRKESYEGQIYNKCEIAKFIVNYDLKC